MNSDAPPRLDIIIPVYNEGANILPTLQSILRTVKTPPRVLICYDREDDDTLPAINDNRAALGPLAISFRAQPRARRPWRRALRLCREQGAVCDRAAGGRRLQCRHS